MPGKPEKLLKNLIHRDRGNNNLSLNIKETLQ
jgi:hypothetical protein